MSTPQITWARGYGAYDATPDNRSADTFGEFLDAVLADRGTRKGQQWIAADQLGRGERWQPRCPCADRHGADRALTLDSIDQ